jgi:hypothetical protein
MRCLISNHIRVPLVLNYHRVDPRLWWRHADRSQELMEKHLRQGRCDTMIQPATLKLEYGAWWRRSDKIKRPQQLRRRFFD